MKTKYKNVRGKKVKKKRRIVETADQGATTSIGAYGY
jgi:hypothetical protein